MPNFDAEPRIIERVLAIDKKTNVSEGVIGYVAEIPNPKKPWKVRYISVHGREPAEGEPIEPQIGDSNRTIVRRSWSHKVNEPHPFARHFAYNAVVGYENKIERRDRSRAWADFKNTKSST